MTVAALAATAIVVLALLWEVLHPWAARKLEIFRANRARRAEGEGLPGYDPGRERRAEQRARELLKSCVNEEEWAMYRDLGFIRVWGGESGVTGETVLSRSRVVTVFVDPRSGRPTAPLPGQHQRLVAATRTY